MKTTIMTEPYRKAFADIRHAIDSEHPVGSAVHDRLHQCVDEFSRLIALAVPAIEHVEIKRSA